MEKHFFNLSKGINSQGIGNKRQLSCLVMNKLDEINSRLSVAPRSPGSNRSPLSPLRAVQSIKRASHHVPLLFGSLDFYREKRKNNENDKRKLKLTFFIWPEFSIPVIAPCVKKWSDRVVPPTHPTDYSVVTLVK